MAVVFISPKQRQKMFFLGITIAFLLFLFVIFLGVFMAEPSENSLVVVFNKPKVNIDMRVFSTEQFKNLQPFSEMQTQYSYKANDKNNKERTGFITAVSMEAAKVDLESRGLIVIELKEVETGRLNPFTPYYTIPATKK